jgi:hypothetical protein
MYAAILVFDFHQYACAFNVNRYSKLRYFVDLGRVNYPEFRRVFMGWPLSNPVYDDSQYTIIKTYPCLVEYYRAVTEAIQRAEFDILRAEPLPSHLIWGAVDICLNDLYHELILTHNPYAARHVLCVLEHFHRAHEIATNSPIILNRLNELPAKLDLTPEQWSSLVPIRLT